MRASVPLVFFFFPLLPPFLILRPSLLSFPQRANSFKSCPLLRPLLLAKTPRPPFVCPLFPDFSALSHFSHWRAHRCSCPLFVLPLRRVAWHRAPARGACGCRCVCFLLSNSSAPFFLSVSHSLPVFSLLSSEVFICLHRSREFLLPPPPFFRLRRVWLSPRLFFFKTEFSHCTFFFVSGVGQVTKQKEKERRAHTFTHRRLPSSCSAYRTHKRRLWSGAPFSFSLLPPLTPHRRSCAPPSHRYFCFLLLCLSLTSTVELAEIPVFSFFAEWHVALQLSHVSTRRQLSPISLSPSSFALGFP